MNATCDDVGTFVLIDAQSTILISHNAGPKPTGKLIAPCQTPIWMHSLRPIATRISRFDKWAIANTKRLVNTSLPPDVELGAGWDACIASLGRSAAQDGIKALMARGFHTPGDVENRLGYYLSQIPR
jgi:hypothetical protein